MLRPDFGQTVRGILAVFAVAIVLIALSLSKCAARDLDGRYATQDPKLHAWFDGLSSGKGLCCSFADGLSIEDVDWDTNGPKDDHGNATYRVRIEWIDVPPEAVVTEPNKFGPAVVWPYQDAEGVTQIRCFLPGAGA